MSETYMLGSELIFYLQGELKSTAQKSDLIKII